MTKTINMQCKSSGRFLDCLFILITTIIIYLPFLGQPAWDGNEPKRAIVAREMLESGNYFTPLIHGRPYFIKPPLMNWLIAASSAVSGVFNEWTARIPSVFMTCVTGLMLYFLTKQWLGRETRFFAALAFLTMIGIMGKGRTAEIDSLFVFLVTLNLLVWFYGYTKQWKDYILWSVSLSLLAVSFLSKGPQAIAVFYFTVFAYLLIKKRIRLFFSFSHGLGILFFLLILACYMISVLQWVSFDEYLAMWRNQILQKSVSQNSSTFLVHFALYPLRILPQFMPWVLLAVPVLLVKDLRSKISEVFKNELFVFSLVMVAVNIPCYWFLPGTRVRYVLPAGPFIAVLTALLFEFYLRQADSNPQIISFFRRMLKVIGMSTLLAAFVAAPAVMILRVGITPALTLLLAALAVVSFSLVRTAATGNTRYMPLYIALISGLIFLVYTEIDIRHDMKKEYYPRKVSREIAQVLPADAEPVYEIGYDRFLRVTYYLDREVIQLDDFSQLKKIDSKGSAYFIYDTDFLNRLTSEEDKKIFLQDIAWGKVYSGRFEKGSNEIVVGFLK